MARYKSTLCWAALVLAALAVIFLPPLLRGYTVNKPDRETELTVPQTMNLYSGDDIGFSFLYPAGLTAGWSGEDGAAVYLGGEGETPYLLVCRAKKSGMSPEKYFRKCDKLMLSSFDSVQSTPIQELAVGDKKLYMTCYKCARGEERFVIDRCVELYSGFYIQYSAVSKEPGQLNTQLYYAISTLRVKQGAYAGAYSDKLTRHSHSQTGMSIKLPDMLVLKELSLGYFASGENAVMLSVHITEDENGKPIYNRQDFIDRAAQSPGFVAAQLGADTAEFSEGHKVELGNSVFYCYPMDMTADGQSFSGELYLANAGETGCWLLCGAVRRGCPEYENTLALCRECAGSFECK